MKIADTTNLPELLDVKQVAAYLRLHRVTVLDLARRGRLPGFKVGREWRFRAEDIRQWVEDQRTGGEAAKKQFDQLWDRLRAGAEEAGTGLQDVPKLIHEVRKARQRGQRT